MTPGHHGAVRGFAAMSQRPLPCVSMTEAALPRPSRFPWLIPAAIFVVVLAALIGVVLFAREAGKSDAPPQPGAFVAPSGIPYTAYDVESSQDGKLKVATGTGRDITSSEMNLPSTTRVWLMEPATAADLNPLLIVNAIGIANEVRNYTIKMMVFSKPTGAISFENPFLSVADGFVGHETSRDTKERVVVSVLLESFDGRDGVTKTSTGAGTLYVDPDAPIRLIRLATPGDIQPGDRIALHHDAHGKPDSSLGVLVLQGGAR